MDLIKEDSLSLEPLDKILVLMPNAGFGDLIAILQKIQGTCTSGELRT
jgi:hypothetical protein